MRKRDGYRKIEIVESDSDNSISIKSYYLIVLKSQNTIYYNINKE